MPEGVQQYALACDAASDLGLSFRLSKKAVKTNPAVAEVAVAAPKPAEPSKVADADKPGDDTKTPDAAKPAASASAPSTGAYVGLFTPISF